MSLEYVAMWGGIPFCQDEWQEVRLPARDAGKTPGLMKQDRAPSLLDELDRLLPFRYLEDLAGQARQTGAGLAGLARRLPVTALPGPQIRIGDWYYPSGACRPSVFRGLATSAAVKAMLALAKTGAHTLTVQTNPLSPKSTTAAAYTVSSPMLLTTPPRPLGETAGKFDGLYLVTLSDERFFWTGTPVTLHFTRGTTWGALITQLATSLGIATPTYSTLDPAYGFPEADSPLWASTDDASILLDGVALNLGRIVVRQLSGLYTLQTPVEGAAQARTSRASAIGNGRAAGGDLFQSGTSLPAGDLGYARNLAAPTQLVVGFPKYVQGDDPVPHVADPRYAAPRPTTLDTARGWGDAYTVTVGAASGGVGSGFVGSSGNTVFLRSTAKALYSGEAQLSGTPLNASGLMALAGRLAVDYYTTLSLAALDEVYPGTFPWPPDAIHDVVWTVSARSRLGCTRVYRAGSWEQRAFTFQHATPPASGYAGVRGVGGLPVALAVRDAASGVVTAALAAALASGDFTATIALPDFLPTQNRWRGLVDNELILFDGTSGSTAVTVAIRGDNGTIQTSHLSGATVSYSYPDFVYGTNLLTFEKGCFLHPGGWTSGGVQGARLVPQTQTVQVLSASGVVLNGVRCFSGQVQTYDATNATPWQGQEYVWATDRNGAPLTSGKRYDGQLLGYSATSGNSGAVAVAPVYGVNALVSGEVVFGSLGSGAVTSGALGSGAVVSGNIASGIIGQYLIGSGAVTSGAFASGIWGLIAGGGTDVLVKVDSSDTTADYLSAKLPDNGIVSFTVGSPGGNETWLADVADCASASRGVVNLSAQVMGAGSKTFQGDVNLNGNYLFRYPYTGAYVADFFRFGYGTDLNLGFTFACGFETGDYLGGGSSTVGHTMGFYVYRADANNWMGLLQAYLTSGPTYKDVYYALRDHTGGIQAGVYGTDPIGNVFAGGIITAIGSGGITGSVP